MADVSQTLEKLRRESIINFNGAVRAQQQLLNTKVPVKTGKLARSQKVNVSTSGSVFTATFVYPSNIANYTDQGTKPHVIRARRGQVLRFEAGGEVLYRRWVKHPGTKGTKWWTKTMSMNTWAAQLKKWFR